MARWRGSLRLNPPATISATATERLFAEVEIRKADSRHPFWRVAELTNRGPRAADPTSAGVAALEKCWGEEGMPARALLAMIFQVPMEWAIP